jgi:hypothetical protein
MLNLSSGNERVLIFLEPEMKHPQTKNLILIALST